MATRVDTNPNTWTLIGTGLTTAVVQISGINAELYIGASAPSASDIGFTIPAGTPVSVPSLSELGGGLWAKGSGEARYDAV
jgi:hypothetical protein|tara:strand:- start:676 stop:918 length:243 start_codon:yes stop_codon:yes gene_type:complete